MRNHFGLSSLCVLAALTVGAACNSSDRDFGAAGAPANGGSSNSGGSSTAGAGSGGAAPSCSALSPCGGSVVGTWNVTSSCLKLSGDMDVSLAGLGCQKVPVVGSLTTTGSFVANANGGFTDNTKTTGSATFQLAKECLFVSSVERTCEQIGSIFQALGWATSSCVSTNGQCNCSVTADQSGGLGTLSVLATSKGQYSTSGNLLTTDDTITPYCVSGDQLTVAPQYPGRSGTIVFSKDASAGGSGGGAGAGVGGSGGTGAAGTAGMGMGGLSQGGSAGSSGSSGAGGQSPVGPLPCDIYAAANTSCVAAHSTVRALLRAYAGNLYQIKRASDGTTKDIPVLSAGGFADAAVQDAFCMGTTCTITKVYDQSGHGNAVEAEIPGVVLGNGANAHEGHSGQSAANAAKESLMVGGHKVYALYTNTSQAYWRDGSATGMPLGASPQGVYVVTSGKHFGNGCCYDYGNGEVSRTYVPGNSMDALYFGNSTQWGSGNGSGPWVMADLEGGVFSGLTTGKNDMLISQPFSYVTAIEKNNGMTELALKAADATAPTLNTYYQGKLPNGKSPGQKQGAIVLGSGGDCCYSNNNASFGTFYEGAIVAGYPSDATDTAVHANIVSAGYGK
ncbi:MAG TPA: arabinofuranosidase catalytic domain-containing protein [Polyangiaceae bacterium]|nr:arabinofuranosidase catalytic domain-containing protein [Polyangiaceae bacterium]